MQKDKPYLDFSVLDESRDYYNVPSFNSLNGKSEGGDLSDKESDEALKNGNASNSLRGRHSYKYEKGPLSNRIQDPDMDKGMGPVNVNKIDFNNRVFREEESRDLQDVKLNIEAIEMALDHLVLTFTIYFTCII